MVELKIRSHLEKVLNDAGGEAGIERLLRAFYKKMESDLLIGYFFQGKDLEHIIQQQKQFLLRAMGAREEYKGKSPRTAHLELPPILKGHFDRRKVLLRQTLEEAGLPQESVQAWVNFEETFRSGIVTEEGTKNKGSGQR